MLHKPYAKDQGLEFPAQTASGPFSGLTVLLSQVCRPEVCARSSIVHAEL